MRAWLAAMLALAACSSRPPAQRTLTVFAAASLGEAFTDLGESVERSRPGLSIRFNFAGSQQLVAQLEQGAPADVFASADERWMRHVVELGLAAGAPVVFARNRLVVVLPESNPGRIERLEDLARPGLKLVLAAEVVPAGRYARQALVRIGETPGFPPDFARRALANVVSEEENVKSVVARVQLAEADAGLAYHSDVGSAVAAHVRVLQIPEDRNVVAEYPIAVLAAAGDTADARAFVDAALGPEGRRMLQRHGLLPATPAR
ncbi:MAG TPA: molybdate ABC transporter substrate-binding protein [Gemmatimonadales bacterium]|nr:molybdate ABC transporter substrate-binding protein [Gemmatimonadales bacterium]